MATAAQTRTYSDNASKTFIIGLEDYFYGEHGSLEVSGSSVSLNNGMVSAGSAVLEDGARDCVIGAHDFTGNKAPELVVARRTDGKVTANVYTLNDGKWLKIGRVGAAGAAEIRVFRQVISIRSGEALYSWTWHGAAFDFKSSDGSAEPVL